jgi:hypothetical protein
LTANFSRWAAGWKSRFRKREKRWGRQLKYRIHSAASCQISHSDLTFLRSADYCRWNVRATRKKRS